MRPTPGISRLRNIYDCCSCSSANFCLNLHSTQLPLIDTSRLRRNQIPARPARQRTSSLDSLTSNPKAAYPSRCAADVPPRPLPSPRGLRSCEYSINAHCLTLERVVYEVPLVFLDNCALFNTHHGTETRRSRSTRRAMKMHLIEASRHE